MITPELLAAIAATIAAIFSGVGLWFAGARDERKWRREVLVDTVVQFLDASFASPANLYLHKRRKAALTSDDHERAAQAHVSSLTALTRLRVLASANVVARAEELHMADDSASDTVLLQANLPDADKWESLQKKRMELRHAVLNAVRRDLGLGKAKAIDPGLFRVRQTD